MDTRRHSSSEPPRLHDVSMCYRFDIGPLSITPSVDYSRIFEWELGDFIINGVKVADGYDGLGLRAAAGERGPGYACV